jgi:hypothetical protein
MDLGRAIGKHAQNDLFGWDSALESFTPLGIKGGLAAYDRFISDRAFGLKKRILLTKHHDKIPLATQYLMAGSGYARFMVEGINEDVYANSVYTNSYMLHEAPFLVSVGKLTGTAKASGVGGRTTFTEEFAVRGDYDRYSAINSKEDVKLVDFTIINLYVPLTTPLTTDHIVLLDGGYYDVTEIARVNNVLFARCQKMQLDGALTAPIELEVCSVVWDMENGIQKEFLVVGSGVITSDGSYTFTRPCESVIACITTDAVPDSITLTAHGAGGLMDPPAHDVIMTLVGNGTLLTRTSNNTLTYATPADLDLTNCIALTPASPEALLQEIFLTVSVDVP